MEITNSFYPIDGYKRKTVSENNKVRLENDCEVKTGRRTGANLTCPFQFKKYFII